MSTLRLATNLYKLKDNNYPTNEYTYMCMIKLDIVKKLLAFYFHKHVYLESA